MKRIVCEMCEGTEFVKDNGLFVCQSCGCKYTAEEARKMMVEVEGDAVPASAPAAVPAAAPAAAPVAAPPASQRLENLYTLARRARDDDNSENAAKYYGEIVVEDPNSWEANFYQIYYTAMSCKIGQIASAANAVTNCLGSVFSLIKDHAGNDIEQKLAYSEVMLRTQLIAKMLYNAALNTYTGSSHSGAYDDMASRGEAALNTLFVLGQHLVEDFNAREFAITVYSTAEELAEKSYATAKFTTLFQNKRTELEEQIQKEKNEAYWAEHAEDKERLEAERRELIAEKTEKTALVKEAKEKMEGVPAMYDLRAVQIRISDLTRQKDMVKSRERKAIQEQIDAQKLREANVLITVREQQAEVDKEIAPVRVRLVAIEKRLEEIFEELTMDR